MKLKHYYIFYYSKEKGVLIHPFYKALKFIDSGIMTWYNLIELNMGKVLVSVVEEDRNKNFEDVRVESFLLLAHDLQTVYDLIEEIYLKGSERDVFKSNRESS